MNAAATRLAVVLSHPTQYYSPWFRWLRAHTSLEFRVFYLWEFGVAARRDPQFQTTFRWDVDLLSGYDHEFVPNTARDPGTHHFGGLRNPTLTARLAAWRPDALLVFGYNWSAHVRTIAWARLRGVRLLFRGDSHFLGRGLPSFAKRFFLRALYAQFDAFLSVGQANSDYFTALGVSPAKLFAAPHSVDDTRFNPADATHRAETDALRRTLNLSPDTRVVLFAGKFTPAKQPRELLQSFLSLRRSGVALVFVGDGPEKPALLELARSGPPGSVLFLPFANQSEMPARLLLADLFVLPSCGFYETWGLAVNEAMHMGVPALVSDRVGCQRDLVTPGQTGWVFACADAASLQRELASALTTLESSTARTRLRQSVLARIASYTYAQTTGGLLAALRQVSTK